MSEPIKIAPEADAILSVKLPVRCSVLGLLVDGLVKQFGDGVTMRQTDNHLEFFAPDPYLMGDEDQEKEKDSPETDHPF